MLLNVWLCSAFNMNKRRNSFKMVTIVLADEETFANAFSIVINYTESKKMFL